MFFDDPVAAFANLRRAAADGGELQCIAWRSAAENPFMTAAERAAAPLLPNLPRAPAQRAGTVRVRGPERVRAILEESGWADIEIRPIDVACTLPEKELVRLRDAAGSRRAGALDDVDARTRAES